MFVLSESPAGYALLKVTDDAKFQSVESVNELFKTPDNAKKVLDLVEFQQFADMDQAMKAGLLGEDSHKKILKPLKKIIKNNILKAKEEKSILLLENPKVGSLLSKKFNITCQANDVALEVVRNIREHLHGFVTDLDANETKIMHRGLAHHFSRFKLQFSAEKEDHMIIHAIKLLEDLDKWLNTLCMRLREWFGINFPELQKVVNDNILFAKIVQRGETRLGVLEKDMSDFLEEDIEAQVKEAAKYSMGAKITPQDLDRIKNLATLIIDYNDDRNRLSDYLSTRMKTIAPNLTHVVGERVGAKLIAHASSLTGLAKQPASTLQIMGAEKALFRAMKERTATPKYGHIYHASLVGQCSTKIRGKIARTLACKASIAARIDAFDPNSNDPEVGIRLRKVVERRIETLTHGKVGRYNKPNQTPVEPVATITKPKAYQAAADVPETTQKKRKIVELSSTPAEDEPTKKKVKKEKKKKKKKRKAEEAGLDASSAAAEPPKKKKKKKKKKKQE